MNIAYLKCSLCGAEYAAEKVKYVCPKHGDHGLLDVVYDYKKIPSRVSSALISESRDFSIWRYWELLPIEKHETIPSLSMRLRH